MGFVLLAVVSWRSTASAISSGGQAVALCGESQAGKFYDGGGPCAARYSCSV